MIVHLHTLVYNEIDRLPFAIPYWEKCATHVFVYLMKSSDDGSREYLEQFKDFVEICEIDDSDGFNDSRNQELKNNVWKKSRGIADFVIVTDFDEFVYSPNWEEELKYMKEHNYTIVSPEIFHLGTYENVIDKYKGNKNIFLHKIIGKGVYDNGFGKHCIFNPNEIQEINYSPGAHICHPIGNVKYYDKKRLVLFHAKYLGKKWFLERENILQARLSVTNLRKGHGVQYLWNDDKKIEGFEKMVNNLTEIPDVFLE